MHHLLNKFLFTLIMFISCVQIGFTLPTDDLKPVHVKADTTTFNYRTGETIYVGNVHVTQGTTELLADKLITYSNKQHKITKAIAFGLKKLVEYTTLPKALDPLLKAKAKLITFYPMESLAVLEGHVIVNQGKNNFQGPRLVYNMKDQVVTAPSSTTGPATIILKPA